MKDAGNSDRNQEKEEEASKRKGLKKGRRGIGGCDHVVKGFCWGLGD